MDSNSAAIANTKAEIRFYNDWALTLPVNTTEQEQMDEEAKFPTPLEISSGSYKPVPRTIIATATSPYQSSFKMQFNQQSLVVDIGRGFFVTRVREKKGPHPEQSYAVLAPVNPEKVGKTDFFFSFIAGNGVLKDVIDSVIKANVVSMIYYIR